MPLQHFWGLPCIFKCIALLKQCYSQHRLLASCYHCMLHHLFPWALLPQPPIGSYPETACTACNRLCADPLRSRVSSRLGQPPSSPILPSGLSQTSTCPTFYFPYSAPIQHKPQITPSLDFPSPVALAYQEAHFNIYFF